MAIPSPVLSEATAAVCFASILLVPMALGGVAMVNAGLARSRATAHSLVCSLCVAGTAAVTWFVIGSALQGYAGRPHRAIFLSGKAWGMLGCEQLFMRGVEFDGATYSLAVVFGLFAVSLAAIIPVGAAAERWRLSASCLSTAFFASVVYPVFAHWAWGGGWLADLGVNLKLGRGFIDSGGAGCVQALGGLSALAISRVLGPRLGKYNAEGFPTAMPGHNVAYMLFGCFLTWAGYIGLDCAGAILFTGADAGHATVVPVNATLAAFSALLAAADVTRRRFGKTDASLCVNAWIAGLAASSAGCVVVRPVGAAVTGLIAGVLVVFSVEWIELHLNVDDPGGAIAVHGIGGVWGLLAAGLFAQTGSGQLLAQIIGIVTLIAVFLPLTYGVHLMVNRVVRQRIPPEGEQQGADLHELGATSYPEFMTHGDDY